MTPTISRQIPIELEDEWKGVVDPRRRRTLQNRLNQRAYRRRLKAAKVAELSDEAAPKSPVRAAASSTTKRPSDRHTTPTISLASTTSPAASSSSSTNQIAFIELDRFRILGPSARNCRRALAQLESFYRAEFAAGSLRTELLLGLTRLNFLRALHANIDVLGYSAAEMHDDAQSPFGVPSAAKSAYTDVDRLPVSLRPTAIQLSTPHHPWLDLLPFPQLRDNLIRIEDSLDDAQLCFDMCGRGSAAGVPDKRLGNAGGETGVIVWRDPWDPTGWEVTETFLRRWGWVLRDCTEVMRATDGWRRARGEPGLFRRVLET
ncbi:hypothetical protein BJY00DRAFT_303787 [Aspergillus carlsbadensis]|nr:hypothetical protein BJY00DRAFT_303787 [Aspergillus carlsbadensis]